uniref:Adenylyl cyclase-associated protein n=1 Tax=Entamoeba invadens TaxID=33085 RepID=S0B1R9_ENTIV|nr:adenylyl cyclase-associated protein, putative [Entamoeba invadens]
MSSVAELKALLAQVMSRLETVTARLEKIEGTQGTANAAPSAGACEGECKAQTAFVELRDLYLTPLVEKSNAFDPILGQALADYIAIVNAVGDFVGMAAKSKKPTQEGLQKLIQPIGDKMSAIGSYKDKQFKSPFINNFSAIAEASQAFAWICVDKTPAPFVNDAIPSVEFYTNKILVATKGKEQDKFDWAINFVKFLKEMVVYIKQYHTTGLTWNPNGAEASAPTAAPVQKAPAPKKEAPKANPAGLFADLNKGTGISGGLKHVTNDMKTKNMKPEDKKPVEPKAAPKTAKPAAAKQAVQKPPKMEKVGNKWDISYQNGNNAMEIEGDFKDSIYIFKCENSTIRVKGKINCISIDNCKKVNLICDTVVSYIELVNCTSIDMRITDLTPTINIDKSQSVVVHLSDKCLDGKSTVNTSKCDAISIAIPNPEDKTDEVEYPVPEQMFTTVEHNKLYPQIYFHDKSSYYFPK